jgi:hypothetical protein
VKRAEDKRVAENKGAWSISEVYMHNLRPNISRDTGRQDKREKRGYPFTRRKRLRRRRRELPGQNKTKERKRETQID